MYLTFHWSISRARQTSIKLGCGLWLIPTLYIFIGQNANRSVLMCKAS